MLMRVNSRCAHQLRPPLTAGANPDRRDEDQRSARTAEARDPRRSINPATNQDRFTASFSHGRSAIPKHAIEDVYGGIIGVDEMSPAVSSACACRASLPTDIEITMRVGSDGVPDPRY